MRRLTVSTCHADDIADTERALAPCEGRKRLTSIKESQDYRRRSLRPSGCAEREFGRSADGTLSRRGGVAG